MHSTRCRNNTDLVYWHLCSIEKGGVHLLPIYICIVPDLSIKLMQCTSMQGISAQWRGVHLPSIYIYVLVYIYRSAIPLHLAYILVYIYLPSIYICIVLDIAIKLIWCTGMQGI